MNKYRVTAILDDPRELDHDPASFDEPTPIQKSTIIEARSKLLAAIKAITSLSLPVGLKQVGDVLVKIYWSKSVDEQPFLISELQKDRYFILAWTSRIGDDGGDTCLFEVVDA